MTDDYEKFMERHHARHRKAVEGDIVTRGKDRPVQRTRQADSTWYLNSQTTHEPSNTAAAQDWDVWIHHIREHTGRHSHQGGITIYILEGRGYTEIDGERIDWKAGDLLILPITPGGFPHQHFNLDDDKPARWIGLIHRPMQDAMGALVEQVSNSSDFE